MNYAHIINFPYMYISLVIYCFFFSLKLCKSRVETEDDLSLNEIKQALYELLWHSLRGKLKAETVVATLNQVYVSIATWFAF